MTTRCLLFFLARLFAVSLTLSANSALAQGTAVLITTGEHDGFTRLVAQSTPMSWRVVEAQQSVQIQTTGPVALNTSRAFERISRDRLLAIETNSRGATLRLNCTCEISYFVHRPGVFVVDIRDRPDLPIEPTDAFAPPQWPNDARQPFGELARAVGADLARSRRLADLAQAEPPQSPPSLSVTPLAAGIAQAATQGLLDIDVEAVQNSILLPPPDGLADGAGIPLLIGDQTAADSASLSENALRCPAAGALDFLVAPNREWGMDAFGTAMLGLVGEFDTIHADDALNLLENLIGLGLGAESSMALSWITLDERTATLFQGIADLMEGRFSNSVRTLAGFHQCTDPVVVFAWLAQPTESWTPAQAMDMAMHFGLFPAPLRFVLGERIVQSLAAAGFSDAARMAYDSLARTGFPATSTLARLEALLETRRGNHQLAADRLAGQAALSSAEALLQLEIWQAANEPIERHTLEAFVALAVSERDTQQAQDLMLAVSLHYAQNGVFSDAFATFDRLLQWPTGSSVAETARRNHWSTLWDMLSSTADEQTFLETLLSRSDWRTQSLGPAANDSLRSRLRMLGLGNALGSVPAAAAFAASVDSDQNQRYPDSSSETELVPAAATSAATEAPTPIPVADIETGSMRMDEWESGQPGAEPDGIQPQPDPNTQTQVATEPPAAPAASAPFGDAAAPTSAEIDTPIQSPSETIAGNAPADLEGATPAPPLRADEMALGLETLIGSRRLRGTLAELLEGVDQE